ncbi:MAG TPA: COX aromatic rich motif-containing protein [Acidiferrobacteraceae bacterium]|nr:COX aromatic rich motif-containing protein [Acidiferrobacteraceae bacterium]
MVGNGQRVALRSGLWGSVAGPLLSGCAFRHGFLNAAGPVALAERHLSGEVVGLMLLVVAPVFLLGPWVIWHYRRGRKASAYRPYWSFAWPLEIAAWGVPLLIVGILGVRVWEATRTLDPYRPVAGAGPALRIQVVGFDWKWLFIYPRQHIATVNVLTVPAGRPVHLFLTSHSVLLSLLSPRLVGQIYAMPGMVTQLNFKADQPGRYLGENTQYDGDGFSGQHFTTLVLGRGGFKRWAAGVQAQGRTLDAAAYASLLRQSAVKRPVYFASVPPHLFHSVVAGFRRGIPPPPKKRPSAS